MERTKLVNNFLIAGDLFTDSNKDIAKLEKLFLELTKKGDLLILNLEGSIQLNGSSVNRNKVIPLSINLDLLKLISKFNICVSLANNHSTDFGDHSTRYLRCLLEEYKIPNFGLFVDGDINDCFIKIGNNFENKSLYIVGCGWENEQCIKSSKNSYGCLNYDLSQLKNIYNHIKERDQNSKIFLFAHFGYEYEFWPLPDHVDINRKLIDYGFEGIFGSHTHTIQDFEFFKNKPIYYGLGNLFFSSKYIRHSFLETRGRVVNVLLNKKQINCQNYIVIQNMDNNDFSFEQDALTKSCLNKDLVGYANSYKFIRIRKKNPRPILYPNSRLYNSLIYLIWKFIVELLGLIKCRKLIKKLLSW